AVPPQERDQRFPSGDLQAGEVGHAVLVEIRGLEEVEGAGERDLEGRRERWTAAEEREDPATPRLHEQVGESVRIEIGHGGGGHGLGPGQGDDRLLEQRRRGGPPEDGQRWWIAEGGDDVLVTISIEVSGLQESGGPLPGGDLERGVEGAVGPPAVEQEEP